jgi:para-nitrobenzyl esterase
LNKTEILNIKLGKIQGYIEDGISIFKGIPYAEPPIGELRYSAPLVKKPWDGVLEAFKYLPVSPQPPPYDDTWPAPPQSEAECLNLNVWTPGCDDKKRPVMFWIHGGAHITGSGQLLTGRELSRGGDVVLVSINYRLGPLGFFKISGGASNIGQLDQICALEWVRDNIEFFGGDPDNVTIFGESAGATSVCTLMAMPKAKHLFIRAISQSGAATPQGFDPLKRDTTAKMVLDELKLTSDDLEELRKLPVETIIDTFVRAQIKSYQTGVGMDFRPWIDGENLPQHPLKAIEEGYARDIEFIAGTNLDEWKFWRAFEPDFEKYEQSIMKERILQLMRSDGEEEATLDYIIKTYKDSRGDNYSPMNLQELHDMYMTDSVFRIPSIKFAEAQSKHQENTYMYLFTWETPYESGRYRSLHALEIAFVFGSFWEEDLFTLIKKTDETASLSDKMMSYWTSFARFGDRNNNSNIVWPRYDTANRKSIILNKEIEIREDPLKSERKMWNKMRQWSQF